MNMRSFIKSIIIALLSFIIVYSVAQLLHRHNESESTAKVYRSLVSMVQQSVISDDDIQQETGSTDYEETVDETTLVKEIRVVDYSSAYDINHDMVGWICIPDTNINYPVVQCTDNIFYLSHGFEKMPSAWGCIFADTNCVLGESDNVIIYGHNMKDDSMFGELTNYKDESFYQSHKYLYFDGITESRKYEIVAVFVTSADYKKGFRYNLYTEFTTINEFTEYVTQIKALSLYDISESVEFGDELITLSTCDYSIMNGRLVVVAKRIE